VCIYNCGGVFSAITSIMLSENLYLITCKPMLFPQIQQEAANLEKSKMQHDISVLENNIQQVSPFLTNKFLF